jgi:hypothetical protein
MSWTEQAFPTRMVNDAELTAQLATYNGRPAVFTYLWIPPVDTDPTAPTKPYIITESDVSHEPVNFKGTVMSRTVRDLRVYGFKKYGSKAVNDIAERIAVLFRSDKLGDGEVMFPDAPVNLIDCMAQGPISAPVEGAFIGRLVRVRAYAEELV